MINYVMFFWCNVFMMMDLMTGKSGLHVFIWAALMLLNAYEVAKGAQ